MPVDITYICEVCGVQVNDADLLAAPSLRRIDVIGTARRLDQINGGLEPLAEQHVVFCGWGHAAQWVQEQTF